MEKIEIPEKLFRYRSGVQDIVNEQQTYTPVKKLSWDNGIFLYLEDAEYPQKGMATPETLWSINLAKRNFIEPLRLLKKPYFWPSIIVMAFSNKKNVIETLIKTYNELSWRAVKPFILKANYATAVSQEIEWITYSFLNNLGVDDEEAEKFAQIFSTLIEYDNAYRYRLCDLFSETTKTKMVNNPRAEVKRLTKILAERKDNPLVFKKFKIVATILSMLLLNGKIKKAFSVAIRETDIRKLQLDEIDRYWVMIRKDQYNYLGKTDEEREQMLKNEGKKKPKLIKR